MKTIRNVTTKHRTIRQGLVAHLYTSVIQQTPPATRLLVDIEVWVSVTDVTWNSVFAQINRQAQEELESEANR